MRSIKQIAITAILTTGIFCAILYTSCQKDGCKGITCLNNSACSGGVCSCPTGVGGTNCQTVYRLLYAPATYIGIGSKDTSKTYSDSASMSFSYVATDSMYQDMQLSITDKANDILLTNVPITISNNSASGSTFTITTPTISDTFLVSGTGVVSGSSASINITLRDQRDTTLFYLVSYSNFTRQ